MARSERQRPARDTAITQPEDVPTAGPRIYALDTLRGFALCGILIISIYQQVVFDGEAAGTATQMPSAVRLLFYERFRHLHCWPRTARFPEVLVGGSGRLLRREQQRTAVSVAGTRSDQCSLLPPRSGRR